MLYAMAGRRGTVGRLARAGAVAVCAVTFTACSGGDDQPSAATAVATPTTPLTEPPAATPTTPDTATTEPPVSSAPDDSTTATDDADTGTATDSATDPGTQSTTTVAGDGGGGDGGGENGGEDGGDDGGADGGGEWEQVDSFPAEAYPAFTDGNWSGVPSPALAADAASLAGGIYHAARATAGGADSIPLEIRRFEACTVAPGDCVTFEGEEIPPEEIAPSGAALTVDLPLDASLRVGVSGVDCQADAQLATGAELAAMMRQFDADYAAAIAEVPQSAIDGDDIGTIVAALLDSPSGRFEAPACFEGAFPFGSVRWRGDVGPGVLLQSPLAGDGDGGFVVPESASAVWIRPSAFQVGDDGVRTLYLDAGFVA